MQFCLKEMKSNSIKTKKPLVEYKTDTKIKF